MAQSDFTQFSDIVHIYILKKISNNESDNKALSDIAMTVFPIISSNEVDLFSSDRGDDRL